jgi:suppressor of fused
VTRVASQPPPGTAAIDEHVNRADESLPVGSYHPRFKPFSRRGGVETVTMHRVPSVEGARSAAAGLPAASGSSGHWHLVTYGLTELRTKDFPDAGRSGWGFELTFRVAGEDSDRPLWAVDLLASLGSYVWASRHPFAAGDHIDLQGPIKMGSTSLITAAAVVEDPVLGSFVGPFGRVQFLQVVGLTADELERCRSWSTAGMLEALAERDRLLVTVLDRPSLLAEAGQAAAIDERSRSEGPAVHELQVASLRWGRQFRRRWVVQLGAGAASALGPALRRELVDAGATFTVIGDQGDLRFLLAHQADWSMSPGLVELALPESSLDAVVSLFDGRTGWKRLADWPGLWFRVVA